MADRKQLREPSSPVRERARKHLRNLLASGAMTGAAAKMAACIPVVCDPIPPPLTCDASQETGYYVGNGFVGPQAHWVLKAGNTWDVAVVVMSYATAADNRVVFSADPVVVGGSASAVTRSDSQVSFTITPPAEGQQARFDLAINCNAVTDTLRFRIDLTGNRENNGNVPVQSAEGEDR